MSAELQGRGAERGGGERAEFLGRGQRRPLVLGHRGASADFPENTLRAFTEALRQGADGVELDVMRCGSGEVVVVHDDDLSRVARGAAGSGLRVRGASLLALQAFDLGGGERVPTLAAVLEALGPQALVNVELKSEEPGPGERRGLGGRLATAAGYLRLVRDDGLAAATVEVLRRAGRLSGPRTTLVSSFDPFQLLRFQRAASGALPLGFLFEREQVRPLREAWPAHLLRPQALHPQAALCTPRSVGGWRRRGYALHTWTVDEPAEVRRLQALGVDAVITNRPAAVRALLG